MQLVQPKNLSSKKYILLTSDLFIENVHFKRKQISFYNIGKRAAARALSDIVACAGVPRLVGVSAGIPKYVNVRNMKSVFWGIRDYCRKYRVTIVGGDTSRASVLFLDIWALGMTKKYILRSTARAGDYIFLTSTLGALKFNQPFELKVKKIQSLITSYKVNAMIDISDGFIIDTYRILQESKKGALLYGDALPLTKGIKDMFRGEDYEIIFTVDKSEDVTSLKKKYFLVGRIRENAFGYKIKFADKVDDVNVKGYLHF